MKEKFIIKATCECGDINCHHIMYMYNEKTSYTIEGAKKYDKYEDAKADIETIYIPGCIEGKIYHTYFQIEKIFSV